jgi:outer membrane protein assembly factor BamE (lipoprotein component of BamABCDE complex)
MNNKQNRQLVGWWGVAVLLVVLVLGPACSREQAPPPPPPQQSAAPAVPAPAPGTTAPAATGTQPAAPAGNISQIQMGMTVDQVKQIMGNPAEMKQKGAQMEYKYYTPQKVEVKFQNNQVVGIETH